VCVYVCVCVCVCVCVSLSAEDPAVQSNIKGNGQL